MKGYKSILLSIVFLALLAFGLSSAIRLLNPQQASRASLRPVYDATGAREAAIVYPKDPQLSKMLPYDANGALIKGVKLHPDLSSSTTGPVYDATGAMLRAINPQPAPTWHGPVYDATGAMQDAVVQP